jgi:hypothetical protein
MSQTSSARMELVIIALIAVEVVIVSCPCVNIVLYDSSGHIGSYPGCS